MNKYVEVVTSLPIDRTFQYKITGRESYAPEIGKRVFIPFNFRKRVGYIVKFEDDPAVENPKDLIDVIDESPIFTGDMLELARWMKDRYFCSWGEALEAMIPGALKRGKVSMTQRVDDEKYDIASSEPHKPNKEQQQVLNEINACIKNGTHKVFLLHGITGSGKTEIYLQAMENVLRMGKSGVILVPEISLTPQTVERFVSRFGDKVAIFHSKMLQSARFAEWKRIKDGNAGIVVGPRSAVFSPFQDPGIFIVDEEHEPSYKQEDTPRYHAREIAIKRARMAGVPVILGTATPALESYHKAVNGEYRLVELTGRIKEKELPRVKVVDMRMDFDTRVGKTVISPVMAEALRNDIKKKQQALIFLNRRGFSTFVNCGKCGNVLKCEKCDSPLVFHKEKKEMICHYCNRRIPPPKICPFCEEDYLMYKGTGTQKVESELHLILPEARIERMDSDTMSKRGAHAKVLKRFKDHEIDIIVGTQMIAKGLDFPKVTQVGVISADANLNLPDFRSSERTFNLITQVAGRAGRGDLGGEVIVQTFTPEHYAIGFAAKHDYHGFYTKEIVTRRELGFPPFVNLVKITLRSRKEENVAKSAEALAERLGKKMPGVDIIGPAPSPMAKLRGYYRWNVLIKTKDIDKLVKELRGALSGFRKGHGVFMAVDVDPMSM
ncbi:MAG: primosomal protein N' [Candidatus Omnitrophica bacterium]|nr:primosomal protein N' [Candidatus Omnitrophota bacterium]MBU1128550.1 primosomal protein N' [Candidatus Omnitrophota bacterium]MBU1656817.1 primosomal protein N' [Candidatus Omnitrophota bacterium]MBU1783742.1 primosomal protein N' [Candidatus Omnitrophota bacterium]MBU1851739.1 primosomal protein N' [Candidatus Omnitrophota bacterium]